MPEAGVAIMIGRCGSAASAWALAASLLDENQPEDHGPQGTCQGAKRHEGVAAKGRVAR